MIPNVEANFWKSRAGKMVDVNTRLPLKFPNVCEISKKDPLVQWYANHTEIDWNADKSDMWGHTYDDNVKIGELKINGEPFWLGFQGYGNESPYSKQDRTYLYPSPAYFLTHGRQGSCGFTAEALHVILELKGYDSIIVAGTMDPPINSVGHVYLETNIDGEIYVLDFNKLVPRDKFYEKINGTKVKTMTLTGIKRFKTFRKEHFLPVVV